MRRMTSLMALRPECCTIMCTTSGALTRSSARWRGLSISVATSTLSVGHNGIVPPFLYHHQPTAWTDETAVWRACAGRGRGPDLSSAMVASICASRR